MESVFSFKTSLTNSLETAFLSKAQRHRRLRVELRWEIGISEENSFSNNPIKPWGSEEALSELRNTSDFTDNIEAKIESYKNYLLLYNDLSFRKFKNYKLDLDDFEEEEID